MLGISIPLRALVGFGVIIIGIVGVTAVSVQIFETGIGDTTNKLGFLTGSATGSATIGEGEDVGPDEAKKQFRQLTAFNMLAAQQCNILQIVASSYVRSQEEDIIGELEDLDSDTDPQKILNHIPENLGNDRDTYSSLRDEELQNRDRAFLVWLAEEGQKPFGSIKDTGYHGECFGVRIDIDIVEAAIDAAVPDVVQNVGEAISGIFSNNADYPFKGDEFTGGSMQGPPGSIKFNLEENFTISEPRLMGLHLGPEFENINIPAFWRGESPAFFIPDIYGDFDTTSDGGDNVHSKNLIANDIRMRNVPSFSSIGEGDFAEVQSFNLRGEGMEDSDYSATYTESYASNTFYAFCDGMEGRIQSNAGGPENTGSPGGSEPIWRDVAFSFVKLDDSKIPSKWNQKYECIDINSTFVKKDKPTSALGQTLDYSSGVDEQELDCDEQISSLYDNEGVSKPEDYDDTDHRTVPLGYSMDGEPTSLTFACGWNLRNAEKFTEIFGGLPENEISENILEGSSGHWFYNWEVIKPEIKPNGDQNSVEGNLVDLTQRGDFDEDSWEPFFGFQNYPEYYPEHDGGYTPVLYMEGSGTAEYDTSYFSEESTYFVGVDLEGKDIAQSENQEEMKIIFDTTGSDISLVFDTGDFEDSRFNQEIQVGQSDGWFENPKQDTYGILKLPERNYELENYEINGLPKIAFDKFFVFVDQEKDTIYWDAYLNEGIRDYMFYDDDVYNEGRLGYENDPSSESNLKPEDDRDWEEIYTGFTSISKKGKVLNSLEEPRQGDRDVVGEGQYVRRMEDLNIGKVNSIRIEKTWSSPDHTDKARVLANVTSDIN